jgi:enoyl-CoA hydratase/carnithine racemase
LGPEHYPAQVTFSEAPPHGGAVLQELLSGGVLRLTLNRPQQRNALTADLAQALRAAVASARSDGGVRAVIVTGAGAAFCAGADLGALASGAETPARRRALLSDYYRAFLDLRDLPVPTIAAVNGAAIGAGFNLALSCDLRILASEARLAAPFLRLGIHPGGGCSWLLTRIAGTAAAREMLFLGQPLPAERALALGLANRVVAGGELAAAALEWASTMAALPSSVVGDLKRTLALAEAGASFDATLAFESAAQAESMATEDAREGWAAFRERREPHFQDR